MKLYGYLLTLLAVIVINFFLPRMMPGDPFTSVSSETDGVTIAYSQEQIEKLKSYYALDLPLPRQFMKYIISLAQGDIGYSIYYNDTVISVIAERALWTISLVSGALILSFFCGSLLGASAAWLRGSLYDRSLYSFMILISELPAFVVALLLLFAGGAWLGWFPLSGGISPFSRDQGFASNALDLLHHSILPLLSLVLAKIGDFFLLSRSSVLSVLSKDYIRTARGKGLSAKRILLLHAVKNAAPPVIARGFMSLGALFGGAILVENIFRYPGAGFLLRESVMVRDYPLIQGIFLLVAFTVLIMNFLSDAVNRRLDSRIER